MVDYVFERHLSGGILLPANKTASTSRPIHRGLLPSRLVLAMRQHRGPAAVPCVRVGDRVLKGQQIATPATVGPSAAVHASSSGRVRAIEEHPVLTSDGVGPSLCIVIETDGRDEPLPFAARPAWPTGRAEQLKALRAAGVVGLGGAVYPTATKLATPVRCKTLIVNGAECEPYISCDDMLMRERAADVVAGALLLADLLATPLCIIAIERDKPRAIAAIEAAAHERNDARLKLAEVPTIYPAGGERQLVELLTGEEVPSGRFPTEFGYVCQNVGTAYAVQRLAVEREPLLSRIVTVTGGGVLTPQNVETPLGTPIAELIGACGGYKPGALRLIAGGSMMGAALPDDDVPVTKAVNCVIAATAVELKRDTAEWPCIRCGDCAMACPSRLLPQELLVAATSGDYAALETLGLADCIECGCCDVICPSHIALTERFRVGKRTLAAREAERVRREQSTARTDALDDET
jgi:electron transport complex protein RnfC